MPGLVAVEHHLWLNITKIHEKGASSRKTSISQSGLFGEAVNSAVDKFRTAKTQSVAFKQFMPRRGCEPPTPAPVPRDCFAHRKEASRRSDESRHPLTRTVWGACGRPMPRQCPRRRIDLRQPAKPAASASQLPLSEGRDRPLKHICLPLRCSPDQNLLYPPPCALGDTRVSLPRPSSCVEGWRRSRLSPLCTFSRSSCFTHGRRRF